MPYHVYKTLGLDDINQDIKISLRMADRSLVYPRGVVENVLVKIEELYVPADFVILDMDETLVEEDEQPIILGRAFMATAGTKIDVQKGILTMTVFETTIGFHIFDAMKSPLKLGECFYVKGTTESHDSPKSMDEPPPTFEKTEPPWNNEDALKKLPFFDEHKMEQAPSLNELQMKAIEDLREALGIRKPKKRALKKKIFSWPPPRMLTPIFPFKCCGGMNNGETSTKASGKKECFKPP
jgi:hypothetical protein